MEADELLTINLTTALANVESATFLHSRFFIQRQTTQKGLQRHRYSYSIGSLFLRSKNTTTKSSLKAIPLKSPYLLSCFLLFTRHLPSFVDSASARTARRSCSSAGACDLQRRFKRTTTKRGPQNGVPRCWVL